jgi:hypothetical protein
MSIEAPYEKDVKLGELKDHDYVRAWKDIYGYVEDKYERIISGYCYLRSVRFYGTVKGAYLIFEGINGKEKVMLSEFSKFELLFTDAKKIK